jgi:hypothetical protein
LQEISRKKPVLKNSSARHVPSCSVESGDKLLGDGRGQFRYALKAAKQALGKSQNKDVPRNPRSDSLPIALSAPTSSSVSPFEPRF